MSDGDGNGEENTPIPGPTLRHPDNLPMLQVLGNYLLEAREHTIRLELLYDGLRQMDKPAPQLWGEKLLEEFERHHEADGQNLQTLRELVKA